MNAVTETKPAPVSGLALLRVPFPANAISKLPKPTRKQTDDVKANFKLGIRCNLCGAWHHKDVVHLDYVGHAALTDRLLDCDPEWNWEPVAVDERGQPALDQTGGMWIKLTVCGVTRLGYGDADGKQGGNAVKERIGDALRNAAMRFGAALDLWHKGDLHAIEAQDVEDEAKPAFDYEAAAKRITGKLKGAESIDDLRESWTSESSTISEIRASSGGTYSALEQVKNTRKAELDAKNDLGGDEIPDFGSKQEQHA